MATNTITNVNDGDKDNKRKNVDSNTISANAMDVDDVELPPTELDSSCVQTQNKDASTPSKKVRCTTSDIWRYFTKVGIVNGKEKAKCNGCGKLLAGGSVTCGTSHFRRHITNCNSLPKYKDVGAMMIDQAGIVRARKIDPNRVREIIAYSIIKHNLPYSFVEYDGIRELLAYLNPDYRNITRKTVVVDVWNFYLHQKDNLKKKLSLSPSRICLIFDCWTTITAEGYLCLTVHFVDEQWNLNSKILSFFKMEPPHTGAEMAKRAHEIMIEWGIEKKVFSITLDNASANFQMQRILKENLNLSNSLICNGEFFHIRCSAHILNLIVQDGLKVAEGALNKIRNSILYVRKSEARMIKFRKRVEQVGGIDTSVGLRYDVPTRWNSTHAMLESALKFRRAFASLALNDTNYSHCPTNEEWSRAEVMCTFLKPFSVITNLISGSSYPTFNMYFTQISKIELLLKGHLNNNDSVIREMAQSMVVKFDKYWNDYSVILALTIILDPRMKLDIIKFTFGKLDPINSQEKVENIRSKLYYVFNEYKNGTTTSSSAPIVGAASSSNANVDLLTTEQPFAPHSNQVDDFDIFDDFFSFKSQDVSIEKSELDYYLEEATLDNRSTIRFNVLDYWKANSSRFPYLSKMAYDILSIPITTVASESAFSIGSRVLTKYRSCLLPDNVEALVCTRNWLLGFPWDEDFETEKRENALTPALEASDNASNIIIHD